MEIASPSNAAAIGQYGFYCYSVKRAKNNSNKN